MAYVYADQYTHATVPAAAEHEALRAAIESAITEALAQNAKDAKRYRWLREQACWGYPSSEGSDNKDAYIIITGYGHACGNNDAVDSAIDAAMKGQP